jgi:hypothetical protein
MNLINSLTLNMTLFGWGDNTYFNRHIFNVFKQKEKSQLDIPPSMTTLFRGKLTTRS